MSRPALLITGVTGTVGGELARQLSARGVTFRALVRDPAKAGDIAALPGAELVTADLDDAASLDAALAGVERAFLLTPSSAEAEARQLRFVAAARQTGVRHLVKLSQLHADAGSPVRFLRYHAAVEQAIRASGAEWTFLRPNLFMQALLLFAPMITAGAPLAAPAGAAAVSLVDVRDIAAAAACALIEDGHAGATYDLTGPEALTHAEIADRIAAASGRRTLRRCPTGGVPRGPGAVRHGRVAGRRPDRGLCPLRPWRSGGRHRRRDGRDRPPAARVRRLPRRPCRCVPRRSVTVRPPRHLSKWTPSR